MISQENQKELDSFIFAASKNPNVIGVILFGSQVSGKTKPTSDIDIAIIRVKNSMPHDFEEISYLSESFDVVFFDKLLDSIKFSCLTQGRVIVLNDKREFKNLRRRFLHRFRDDYMLYQRSMRRMIADV